MKLLLTSAGFQGGATLVKELKRIFKEKENEEITIIGTDLNGNSVAKFYCDKFYRVSPALFGGVKNAKFVKEISQIIEKDKVDIVLSAGSYDCYGLSFLKEILANKNSRTEIMTANELTIFNCNNKYHCYWEVRNDVKLPRFTYWHKGYCIKPLIHKGGRGITFIDTDLREDNFDRLIVMEKLEGEEIDIDCLFNKGELLLAICKTRERVYGGTLIEGEIVDRPELVSEVKKIGKVLNLRYLNVIQFMGGKLLEVNPRMAGAMFYFNEWNIVWLAIKLALKELSSKEIKTYQQKIPFGRRIYRYLEQIEK